MDARPHKVDFLEGMFQRYPDVPREVIVKEDVLREGVAFALEAVTNTRRTYQTFSFEKEGSEAYFKAVSLKMPENMEISGGLYGLRKTSVRIGVTDSAPYSVELRDGVHTLCAQGVPIATLSPFPTHPAYFDRTFPDGTRYGDVVQAPMAYNRRALVMAFNTCQYWGHKEECGFCDINENYRAKKALGQFSLPRPYKDPDQVRQVFHAIVHEEEWPPEWRPRRIVICGGQITTKLAGLPEAEFYLRYAEATYAGAGPRWPIMLEIAPKPREVVRRFREAGVDTMCHNLEVWDKRLFQWICPGKERYVGRDNWVRLMVEAVEEMGESRVHCTLVAGVEMAKPYGFATIGEAIKSTSEGIDFLLRNGIFVRPTSWVVSRHSRFRDQAPPPLEYFIEIDRAWFERWQFYRLYPPLTSGPVGPGLGTFVGSACTDMEEVPRYRQGFQPSKGGTHEPSVASGC